MKHLLSLVLLVFFVLFTVSQPALAASADTGAKIFETHCAGCHINGGNIVRRGKNLKLKTLQRNQMDSIEAIANIVANGKNNMSAYQDRLTEQQIQEVSAYVLEQAQQNWR
ncbi:c-type cytochrome [Phormidium tenue FACHB-886]|nr:c-type cytochrome [Phormidium tenue FACHB-886]